MTNPLTFEGSECQHGYYSDCPSCDVPSYYPDPFSPEPDEWSELMQESNEQMLDAILVPTPDVDPFDTDVDDWSEDYWR